MPDDELPAEEVIEEEVAIVADEVDELQEMLAVQSILSEERHDEIIEGVQSCRESLNLLQTQVQQTPGESPLLNRIMEAITENNSRLTAIEAKLENPKPSQTSPELSTPPPTPSQTNPNPQSGEDPGSQAPPIPKRRRVHRI